MIASLFGRPSIRGWELRQGIESLVAQVCKSASVPVPRVEWDPTITTAAVDRRGGVMVLAAPADDAVIARPQFTRYVGFVLHEVLHLVYTTDVRADGYLHRLWNAVEDAWIEQRGIAARVTGNMGGVLGDLLRQMGDEALRDVSDWTDPAQYPWVLAVYLRPHAPVKMPLAQGLEPIFSEARVRLAASQSSQDNLRIAEWVLSQLQNLGQQGGQEGPQEAQEGGDQGEGKGTPQDGQEGAQEGEGQGEGQDGEAGAQGEGQDGQGQDGEGQDGQGQGQGQGQDGEGQDGEGQPCPGPARAPDVMQAAREVEPSADLPVPGTGSSYCPDSGLGRPGCHLFGETDPAQVQPVGGKLRNEVRRLFDNSGTSAFQRNRKAGSLNVSALHRVGQSDRLFQRRQETEGIDSAVILLVDMSGSMSSGERNGGFGRRSGAVSACLAIHEALTSAGAAVAVYSFQDEVSVAVPWGTPTAKARATLPRLYPMGGTNDAFAVRYCHEVLLRRSEQRRVLMVLTDAGGQQDEVRAQIASASRLGIGTIGIGIRACVGEVYDQSVDVMDMADLGRAALSQLKVAA